jgi:hypothetical protein
MLLETPPNFLPVVLPPLIQVVPVPVDGPTITLNVVAEVVPAAITYLKETVSI